MSPQGVKIAKTIAATAAITLVFASIFLFLYFKFYVSRRRREKNKVNGSFRREDVAMASHQELKKSCRNVKEMNDYGNGMDSLSLRKLEGGQVKTNFPKFVFNPSYNGEEEEEEEEEEAEEKRVDAEGEKNREKFKPQEAPLLLHELSSDLIVCDEVGKPVVHSPTSSQSSEASFTLTPPIVPKKLTPLSQVTNSLTPPPPQRSPPPPLPPPPPPPPVPPPLPSRAKPPLPPPITTPTGWISSRRTPIATNGRATKRNNIRPEAALTEESSNGSNIVGQVKLKPLHWDKVTADVDHSTVWDEINDGSLRFDDELMENLFGYSTTNRQSSERNNIFTAFTKSYSSPPTQIFILDPRKSQNTAIVLRSLATSRREILDALVDGQELSLETLEKLTKISPTQEEASKILNFNGNPSKLADAESFLYHILKSVPSAFTRLNAMLFRASYDPEILHFKESLQTLELGCQELRSRGLFLKLLEAILKAGNIMNAGTSRGNAQGFNLNALKKLSDIRSNDGKTSLLHFVVEQVARSEGKRNLINENYQNRISTNTNQRTKNVDITLKKEEKDKEYLLLGLPMLEGLSKELSNVKKAATIDYESFSTTCNILSSKVAEIRRLLLGCNDGDDKGWFAREMKGFLEECEEEIKVVREEQNRVLEIVKRTTDYYQAGVSKERGVNPFQLFVIVKDFLDMVDQVCVETCRKMQKKVNVTSTNGIAGSGLSTSPPLSLSTRFSNFKFHFMSDMSLTSSDSDLEDEF